MNDDVEVPDASHDSNPVIQAEWSIRAALGWLVDHPWVGIPVGFVVVGFFFNPKLFPWSLMRSRRGRYIRK
jgi:hypothetical protein